MDALKQDNLLFSVDELTCELYGSLACTGIGHGTDFAILMGLEGENPETIEPEKIPIRIKEISKSNKLNLYNEHIISFTPLNDIKWFINDVLPYHSNGLKIIAYNNNENIIKELEFYSIGGGFVIVGNPNKINAFRMFDTANNIDIDQEYSIEPKYKFRTAKELENLCWALVK